MSSRGRTICIQTGRSAAGEHFHGPYRRRAIMGTFRRITVLAAVLALCGFASAARAQEAPYRINDHDAKRVIERIEKSADSFRKSLHGALEHSHFDSTRAED